MRNLIKKASLSLTLALAAIVFAGASNSFAATLLVDPDATGCATADLGPFATIPGALSAAGTGDTIFVCPNYATQNPNSPEPYAGPIVVAIANLTIIGVSDTAAPGGSRVLIASNVDTPATGGATSESRGIVTLDAAGITFGNFTVDGGMTAAGVVAANAGTGAFNGVVVTDDAAGTTVFNTTIQNITNAAAGLNDNFGNGIVVEGGTAASAVSVLNNTVSNFRSNGIFVGDALTGTSNVARALVRGNFINGNSIIGATAPNTDQRGIVFSNNTGGATFASVGAGTTGDIFNNRVSSLTDNVGGTSTSAAAPVAIGFESINGGVTTRFNVLTRNRYGIVGTNTNSLTVNNNQVIGLLPNTTESIGIIFAGSDGSNGSNFNIVQQNTIENNTVGILFGLTTLDTSAGNTARQNTIQDAQFGVANFAISTTIGSGATANTFIQVDNFVF